MTTTHKHRAALLLGSGLLPSEASRRLGVSRQALHDRIKKGGDEMQPHPRPAATEMLRVTPDALDALTSMSHRAGVARPFFVERLAETYGERLVRSLLEPIGVVPVPCRCASGVPGRVDAVRGDQHVRRCECPDCHDDQNAGTEEWEIRTATSRLGGLSARHYDRADAEEVAALCAVDPPAAEAIIERFKEGAS
jgi:hypothetical protein